MKRVLVTGAKGFIGSHIYRLYREKGYEVTGWDITYEDTSECMLVDMRDFDTVRCQLSAAKPDIIIHCAGLADVRKSVENPEIDYESNVTATHNLLFALLSEKQCNCRVVFLSSAAVYGNPDRLPISEDAPLNPLSPYALHKIMCENICRFFHTHHNLDVKIVRIFSAYGIGLKKQLFWDMACKVKKEQRLNMFGTGNESRDYINIADLVNAVRIIAEKAPFGELVYNVANGEEVTIRQAVELFAKYSNTKEINFNGVVREGEPLNWCADISKLANLGYKKSVCIEDGIKGYVEWGQEISP
ncbi:MAG: NAD-dependent epimerase/dehydratase family protein [Acutalibacteraceae bacterium]